MIEIYGRKTSQNTQEVLKELESKKIPFTYQEIYHDGIKKELIFKTKKLQDNKYLFKTYYNSPMPITINHENKIVVCGYDSERGKFLSEIFK